MWLSIDLKQLEDHLHFLEEESREVARLIDSLAGFAVLSVDPERAYSIIRKLDQEADCIKRRKQLLERVMTDLRMVNGYVKNELNDALNTIHEDL